MTLKDLKIGTQLRIGLGAILALVALLGTQAWFQADRLWQETKGLHDHPLTVRRSLDKLTSDILSMHGDMKDLVMAEDEQERQSILQGIDTHEADAPRQFDVLYDRYLGPRSDIDDARDSFVQWRSIRDETIRLLREGRTTEAVDRTKFGGVEGSQVKTLWERVQKISDFARNKGDQFYAGAQKERDDLKMRLGTVLGAVILLCFGIGYLLLKGIKEPLRELTGAADEFRRGDLDARSRYSSANEYGTLSVAFNTLAETVQTAWRSKESAARLTEVMLREQELRSFCRELVKGLMEQTGSEIGALYLLNDSGTAFEHFESIGLGPAGRASFSAAGLEGEFGAALATGTVQRLTDIPEDTRFTFATVGGDFRPREIITIPVPGDVGIVAVISLASVRSYPAPAVRLVNDVWNVMIARLDGVLAFRKVRTLAEKLEHQNRELDARKKELSVQTDELTEQNAELEMQKRQLDDASRLKSVFLSNMSHELRTPLNSVIALAGVLSRRLQGVIPEEEFRYLEVIERNGKDLLALIGDILDLSRIEAGRHEVSLSWFSIRELAAEVVATIEPQSREKGVGLINKVGGDVPAIRSDLSMCRHILQNLVGNAVKFTREGRVEISAVSTDDGVRISVTDTGIGIAADQMAQIFDEFRQADESTTRIYGGTGLGLSIARKYAILLRGNIAVESTPGKGSTFTLSLPLTIDAPNIGEQGAEWEDDKSAVESGIRLPIPTGQGQCILLVEDNEPAVIQMTDILSGQGYRLGVARDGREALEQIEKTLPDAVILDLTMPEVDGFEVLKKIRNIERTAHLPVLILTAKYVTPDELGFLKENHIHQLIQKGNIDKRDLLQAIGEMVSPRQNKPAAPKQAPAQARVRTRASGKPVILVVEDNPDSLLTVRALLQDFSIVVEAADGREGLEQARAVVPDLILMDLSLPVLDGFQALEAIRAEEDLRHIPVLALTASAMKGNREEVLARGFDGYITKPIDRESLEAAIRERLHGSK